MRRMSRPSPALVVAMIALIAALAGSAVAQQATTAQTKKVKATKIIVKGSITGKLLKSNAVTTSKVRNNNLTGSDIRESTLGKVPSAASADTAANAANATRAATADRATLADGLSNQVNFTPRRVAATDGADQTASRLAAPKVALGTLGQFSYYAKCFSSGTTIGGAIYVESTVDRALMDADSEELDGGAAATDYLNTDSTEPSRELKSNSVGNNSADIYENHNNEFLVMAPNLDTYRGEDLRRRQARHRGEQQRLRRRQLLPVRRVHLQAGLTPSSTTRRRAASARRFVCRGSMRRSPAMPDEPDEPITDDVGALRREAGSAPRGIAPEAVPGNRLRSRCDLDRRRGRRPRRAPLAAEAGATGAPPAAVQTSGTLIHPLPGPQVFPESVAVDPASGRYWATSVKDGTIFTGVVGSAAPATAFSPAGVGADHRHGDRLRARPARGRGTSDGEGVRVRRALQAADRPDAHGAAARAHVAQRRRVRCTRRRLFHRLHRACAVAGAAHARSLPPAAVPRLHRHVGDYRTASGAGDQRQRDRGQPRRARPGDRQAQRQRALPRRPPDSHPPRRPARGRRPTRTGSSCAAAPCTSCRTRRPR